ncbi:PHP domain-containing protein [Tundrisphaera lichenicola]|uniref:PHP domain-containing protein n=1 Tax=Tundrisphaera lichenicola TaxID=2029860 RepID=UPI003EBDBDC5
MGRALRLARSSKPARFGRVDLHVHTTHSDGQCSPGEVVRAAANVGLSGLAITDHDTLSAISIARPEADRLGIELIGGIELTSSREGRELHVLGHFVREDDPALVEATSMLREARSNRIEAMARRLGQLGLSIDLDVLRSTFPRATLGRKHLADWLVHTEQVADYRDAFARFLGDDGPTQVEKPRVPFGKAIELIRGAGGVAGLAHPPYDLRLVSLREMVDEGLGAIEVDGPGIGSRLGRRWRDWADEFGLAPIAGSDFHASDRPGRWVGVISTSPEDLDRLRLHRPVSATD